jgi:hypothetical protein
MTTTADGGADEEDADAYLDRLADALTILAPRPILPQDHATMARQIEGVGRALAIDLYQPGTNDNIAGRAAGRTAQRRGSAGQSPGAGANECRRAASAVAISGPRMGSLRPKRLMHAVWLTLDGAREVNFLEYVVPPTLYDDRGPSDRRRVSRLCPRGSPSGSRRNDANVARSRAVGEPRKSARNRVGHDRRARVSMRRSITSTEPMASNTSRPSNCERRAERSPRVTLP